MADDKIFGFDRMGPPRKPERKPLDLKKVVMGFLAVAIPFVIIFILARQHDASLEVARNTTANATNFIYNFTGA